MTPDLNHSIDTHNQMMKEWWRRPEYIKERKAFVRRNPICNRCGRPSTTPGHSHEQYRDYETYLAAVVNGECNPLCNACNLMERKDKKPCSECVRQMKDKIHYIDQDQEMCFHCVLEEVKQKREARAGEFKEFVRRMQDKENAKQRDEYKRRKEQVKKP
jgi:hypothetical protein